MYVFFSKTMLLEIPPFEDSDWLCPEEDSLLYSHNYTCFVIAIGQSYTLSPGRYLTLEAGKSYLILNTNGYYSATISFFAIQEGYLTEDRE